MSSMSVTATIISSSEKPRCLLKFPVAASRESAANQSVRGISEKASAALTRRRYKSPLNWCPFVFHSGQHL